MPGPTPSLQSSSRFRGNEEKPSWPVTDQAVPDSSKSPACPAQHSPYRPIEVDTGQTGRCAQDPYDELLSILLDGQSRHGDGAGGPSQPLVSDTSISLHNESKIVESKRDEPCGLTTQSLLSPRPQSSGNSESDLYRQQVEDILSGLFKSEPNLMHGHSESVKSMSSVEDAGLPELYIREDEEEEELNEKAPAEKASQPIAGACSGDSVKVEHAVPNHCD